MKKINKSQAVHYLQKMEEIVSLDRVIEATEKFEGTILVIQIPRNDLDEDFQDTAVVSKDGLLKLFAERRQDLEFHISAIEEGRVRELGN